MKDLRTRRDPKMPVDLEGPDEWNRGSGWEDEQSLRRPALDLDHSGRSARHG
jgi:hypothetical protein